MLHHPDAIARHAHARHERLLEEAADARVGQPGLQRPTGLQWCARVRLAGKLRTLGLALRSAADRLEGAPGSSPLVTSR